MPGRRDVLPVSCEPQLARAFSGGRCPRGLVAAPRDAGSSVSPPADVDASAARPTRFGAPGAGASLRPAVVFCSPPESCFHRGLRGGGHDLARLCREGSSRRTYGDGVSGLRKRRKV